MKILIFEKHLKKILADPDIISEQMETANDERSLIVLQNRINDIIDKKQKEILDKTGIKIIIDKGAIKLQIGEKAYNMKPMVQGVYALVLMPKSKLSFGGPADERIIT